MINIATIKKLLSIYSENKEMLDIIFDALWSFEEYHFSIAKMELSLQTYSYKVMENKDYQYMVKELDKRRSMQHNCVLSSVNILNRIAIKENLEPVYEGIVSEQRPYRREVADSVLEYIEQIIKERR